MKFARLFYIYLTSRFSWDPSQRFPLAPQLSLISHGIVNLQHNIQLYIVTSKKHIWTPRNHFQTPYRQANKMTTHQTLHRSASSTSSCTTTARDSKLKLSRVCCVHGVRSTADAYTDCWNILSSHISGSPFYIRCLFICYVFPASIKWWQICQKKTKKNVSEIHERVIQLVACPEFAVPQVALSPSKLQLAIF